MNFRLDESRFLIDVQQSPTPGQFCFTPIAFTEDGGDGMLPMLTYFGPAPAIADAEIVGYIWEGSAAEFDKWFAMQEPWLAKLNIRKGR